VLFFDKSRAQGEGPYRSELQDLYGEGYSPADWLFVCEKAEVESDTDS
jgi:hypothetical protein